MGMPAKTYKKKILTSLVAASIAMASQANAGEQEKAVVDLGDVVVTATRTEKDVASAPGSFSVVSKKEIESRNIESLDEALNTTVGVFNDNKGKGLMGTTSSVSMRGMSYDKRVLFLLDGVTPLNDAYTGGVSYQLQSVEDIERIEVVKGPFSSLYGGNAMAGVVNVITRMPEKREFTLKTGYGSSWDRGTAMDDLSKVYLSYGDKFYDKFSLLASYGRKSTNGYATNYNVQSSNPSLSGLDGGISTTSNTGEARYLIGDTGDNTWQDDQLTLKGKYDMSSRTKVNLSFMRTSYEYGYEEPHTYLRDAAGNEVWSYSTVKESSFLSGDGSKEQNIYGASLETELSTVKARLSLGYQDVGSNWYVTRGSTAATTQSGGPGVVSDTPSSNFNSDLQFDIPVFDRQLLTLGGSYRTGKADSKEHNLSDWKDEDSKTTISYEAGGEDRTYSLFVQDEIEITSTLTAYLGCRQDWWKTSDGYANSVGQAGYPIHYDSKNDSSFTPKAALVYKPFEATTLRVSAGQAFRAPSTYDLYRTWTSSTGTTYAANPDLKPETVTSYDGGIEQGLWAGMKVKATYFENQMDDLIYRRTVTPTLQENINAGKARSRGLELEAEQKFDIGLKLFANYTYTDAKILKNAASPASEGSRMAQVPMNMFNAGVGYDKGPYSASLIGRYVDKRYGTDTNTDIVDGVYGSYDAYFVADAKASYKVSEYAEVSVSVDNIFDEDYFGYYKGAGRSIFGELTLRF